MTRLRLGRGDELGTRSRVVRRFTMSAVDDRDEDQPSPADSEVRTADGTTDRVTVRIDGDDRADRTDRIDRSDDGRTRRSTIADR